MNQPTLKNIAEKIGVYPSTVSRVLRGDKKCFISQRKKTLIQEYAKQINYQPNIAARNLVLKRTSHIAVVLGDFSHLENVGPFTTNIIQGIQECAEKESYIVSLVTVACQNMSDIASVCSKSNVYDGIIFGAGIVDPAAAKVISGSRMPVVCFGVEGLSPAGVSCVTTSKQEGVVEAVRHLKQLGHDKIACFGNHHGVVELYRNAVVANSCVSSEELVFFFPSHDIYRLTLDAYCHADTLLANMSKFTAIFCTNDFVALGLCERMKQNGIMPGKDISVIGFDDIEDLLSVREEDRFLTTVHKPRKEMGREAFQMLLGIIRGGSPSATTKSLACRLVVRKTTKAI